VWGASSLYVERKAHWPGAAASDLAIETKLNRLLPVQCSGKLAPGNSLHPKLWLSMSMADGNNKNQIATNHGKGVTP